jgi:hypothetical protein
LRAAILAVALACGCGSAWAQDRTPSYEIVRRDPGALEIRFYNMPMRDVRADDAQNALLLNFNSPTDDAVFERLAADAPDWIDLAYGNYDTGVIRATRPVTYLTRHEQGGFSLRILARSPVAQAAPKPIVLRGPLDNSPPPLRMLSRQADAPQQDASQQDVSPHNAFGAARNHYALELAVNRDDPALAMAYDRANGPMASSVQLGGEWRQYHGGDTVIASSADARLAIGAGLSLIGGLDDTNLRGKNVRFLNGQVGAESTNIVSGSGGFAIDLWDDQEIQGKVLAGNGVLGGTIAGFSDSANSFWNAALTYHQPYLDTPEAARDKADRDEITLGMQDHLAYGLWGGLTGFARRYGVTGSDHIATTAGWTGNLRWSADLGDLLAGLAYDGRGEYLVDHRLFTTSGVTFQPLGIRDMETHTVTGSLSANAGLDGVWFDLFGGYGADRYASDGAIYGASLRYTPEPGVDLAFGVRHSAISLIEGETGSQTSAGLSITLGFGDLRRGSYFSL